MDSSSDRWHWLTASNTRTGTPQHSGILAWAQCCLALSLPCPASPRLASPLLTNNSCQQWDAMPARRTAANVPVCLFVLIVPLCVNVASVEQKKVRTGPSGISWRRNVFVWVLCVYRSAALNTRADVLWESMLTALNVSPELVVACL